MLLKMACVCVNSPNGACKRPTFDLESFNKWATGQWKVTIINEAGQTRLGFPVVRNGKADMQWIHGADVESVLKVAMGLDKAA